MVCPESAIDAKDGDWGMLYNDLPKSYNQFRPLLEKDITKGKFRWHIDPDAINYEDTQLCQRRQRKKASN